MNRMSFLYIISFPLFVISLGLACSLGSQFGSSESGETSVPQENAISGENLISDVQNLDEAVVLIDTEGSYLDPSEGWQVNAGSWGTGFFIDPSGIAVTNNHVVTGASKLKVWVHGEDAPRSAKILGVSECYDLAVIDVEGEGFPYVEWYEGEINAGIDVYSAGFPSTASDVDYTLTNGIVSKPATSLFSDWASVDNVIAHTAKIIGGNSGGPLVDDSARVLGVNYANVNVTDENYAISRDVAAQMISQLAEGNDVESIGINGTAVSGELFGSNITGLWVRSVKSGSKADNARIQAGDIILDFENQVLNQDVMKDYCDVLRSHKPEDTLSVTVLRSGTGEILSGQLNGRELEHVSSMQVSEEATGEVPGDSAGQESDLTQAEIDENVFYEDVSSSGDVYYFEDFNQGMGDWEYFLVSGEEESLSSESSGGVFFVDLNAENTYVYYQFKDWEFNNVSLTTTVENLGEEAFSAGLVCRISDDGWYEAVIGGSGDYFIYYYDAQASEDNYINLLSGNSSEIQTGSNAVNNLSFLCTGSDLIFIVNGTTIAQVDLSEEEYPILEWGQVGFTIGNEEVTPVSLAFDDFWILYP